MVTTVFDDGPTEVDVVDEEVVEEVDVTRIEWEDVVTTLFDDGPDVVDFVDEEVVERVVEEEVAVPEDVPRLVPQEYTSSLFPAPQYSVGVPSQTKLQSVTGARVLPACKAFPQ